MRYLKQWTQGDGAGGSGAGAPEGGKPEGNEGEPEKKPPASEPGAGGDGSGEDVSGLKSALEKERAARKALADQLRELREAAGKGQAATEELEALRTKLADFEFRDRRQTALEAALEKAREGGKFRIDATAAANVAGKLTNPETIEADIDEVVGWLRVPVEEDDDGKTKKKPPIGGQPKSGGNEDLTKIPPQDWAKLKREDPDAYKRMIQARRANKKFAVFGQ